MSDTKPASDRFWFYMTCMVFALIFVLLTFVTPATIRLTVTGTDAPKEGDTFTGLGVSRQVTATVVSEEQSDGTVKHSITWKERP